MVLKQMIFNSFYFRVGCAGLERTDFTKFLLWEGCDGQKRTDFYDVLLWEGVVVLKELLCNSFLFGRVWWS